MMWIPGGPFLMGSDHKLAQDNERPAHRVKVDGFWMDSYHVTNAEFRKFVEATGYVTTAERKPDGRRSGAATAGHAKPPDSAQVPSAMVFVGTPRREVNLERLPAVVELRPGRELEAPAGPGSRIEGKDDHPVAGLVRGRAGVRKVGRQAPAHRGRVGLAARGGPEQATYAWGDDPSPRASRWRTTGAKQGRFQSRP